MTKEEKIQEAYGKHYEHYKNRINKNGWLNCRKIDYGNLLTHFEVDEIELKQHYQRPKSLQGIETNNGWIKIESEFDVPNYKTNGYYCVRRLDGKIFIHDFSNEKLMKKILAERFSHYQLINNPKPPIY